MPRERNPNRNRAAEIYRKHNGDITNRKIAEILGEDEKVIAVWKQRDKKAWGIDVVQRSIPKVVQQKTPKAPRDRPAPPLPSEELTDKERTFAMEYLRDFNATRAAMAAGYSKKTAYVTGWEILRRPRVAAEVERLKEIMAGELWLDIKRVIAEYMKIAFTDVTDLLEFGQREVPVMSMFGPVKDEEGKPMTKLVNYVDFRASGEIDGTVIAEVKQGKDGVSIKLHDKMRALEKLEKYVGFMSEADRLKVQKLQAEVKALTNPNEGPPDDGFIEALKGKAAEVWGGEDADLDDSENES